VKTRSKQRPRKEGNPELRCQFQSPALHIRIFSTLCDNQCLSFVGVLLGKALKTIFPKNYPYSSSFHTETRRAVFLRLLPSTFVHDQMRAAVSLWS
jgi:hypothetical protein